jgi:hypothetical protein
MIREAPVDRTMANIERAGASLGWSGWEIRGAQAASVLLFSDVPELQAERDLNEGELRQFGNRLADAIRRRNLPAGEVRLSQEVRPIEKLPHVLRSWVAAVELPKIARRASEPTPR